MRVIKPGKLVVSTKKRTKGVGEGVNSTEPGAQHKFAVWEDYVDVKKSKKKKAYQRDSSGDLVPVQGARSKAAGSLPEEEGEEENLAVAEEPAYIPRNDFEELEVRLGYTFSNRTLIETALTHRSALNFAERADYERLEFLGDAVLDLAVADLLSTQHPEAREGELSKMRAALVNTHALAAISRTLELGPYIRLGRGEMSSGGNDRPSILADVFEALVGAMYRDANYETVMAIVDRIFGTDLKEVTPSDPKTELQEFLHVAGCEPPSYLLEMMEGPEHSPTFITVVIVDGEIAGRGKGPTKKGSQQEAAKEALERLFVEAVPLKFKEGQDFFIEESLLTANPFG